MIEAIKDEINALLEIFYQQKKNPFFYLWCVVLLFLLIKLWKLYIILIMYISLQPILIFMRKNPEIIVDNNSQKSIFMAMYTINTLKALENHKFSKNLIIYFAFFYAFRIIFGFSFKAVKLTFTFFKHAHQEYDWANIKNKKIKKKIILKFLSNSFEKFIFYEFIIRKPCISEEMTFTIAKRTKTIKITVLN